MSIHQFQASLDSAAGEARKGYWLDFYRQAFPDFYRLVDVPADGRAQRQGIDRRVLLRDGTEHRMQEKHRNDDWGDVLVEIWSDVERHVSGWVEAPASAYDFLAYVVPCARYGLLFPWPIFRQVWLHFGSEWTRAIQPHKFATSSHNGRFWRTENVPIPTATLLGKVEGSRRIDW